MRYVSEVLKRHPGMVALLDESFELDAHRPSGQFYIVSGVILKAQELDSVAKDLATFNFGEPVHASKLARAGSFHVLEDVGNYFKANNPCSISVICTVPTAYSLATKEMLRGACLHKLLSMLFETKKIEIFILDSSNNRQADESDRRLHRDLKSFGRISPSSQIFHQWPIEVPVLGLPDYVAWSLRQLQTGASTKWIGQLGKNSQVEHIRLEAS